MNTINSTSTKERPILFSAPMVRALLDGTKTQTRRVAKLDASGRVRLRGHSWHLDDENAALGCPHGQPGDQLWVRETFFAWGRWETRFNAKKGRDEWHFVDMTQECGRAYVYAADAAPKELKKGNRRDSVTPSWWRRPAIFMPRWASRISLEITGVRVERLQDISRDDAMEEGIVIQPDGGFGLADTTHYHFVDPRESYWSLWEAINGPGSVEANPWVWAVAFKVITP